jgi:hypothetical protein
MQLKLIVDCNSILFMYINSSEGHSNYPAYNSKMPLHNMSEYKFLLRDKKDVNKNTMGWVSQLRSSYTNEPLHRITNAK